MWIVVPQTIEHTFMIMIFLKKGYQNWMDKEVKHAHHFIMVSEPLSRIASMYYYERGYTKQRGYNNTPI